MNETQGSQEDEENLVIENAKDIRCNKFLYDRDESCPRCYFENTSKEELVLEHVLEYKRNYKIMYDPDRKLLLAPKNECGIRKFICTTIRPTKMPFVELYNWDKCSKFIADFLEYEELAEPDKLPETIPSPANVLKWQAGDSFDFSIILASLLSGAGYDAFVVYGTAPKFITTKDESLMDCPFETFMEANEEDDDPYFDPDEKNMVIEAQNKKPPEQAADFKVEQTPELYSKFDRKNEDMAYHEAQANQVKALKIDDDQPDLTPTDEFDQRKSRKHAWILIQKGPREVPKSFFIEPTTGRRYEIDDSPYFQIECVFNHKNFFINQDTSKQINEVNFDFNDDPDGEWEYVMLMNQDKVKKGEDDEEGAEDDEEGEGGDGYEDGYEELDMPPSWSPKLMINKDQFLDLCPGGEKTVFYKKCKVDIYSDDNQIDGLIKRITLYHDFKMLIIQEIRSYYKNRQDKLRLRRRFPYGFKTIEHYESSEKIHYWKKMIKVDSRYRKIFYYHHRNEDGLVYREEQIGKKTFEKYKGRPDCLVYRSVTFDPDRPVQGSMRSFRDNWMGNKEIYIKKMSQKYEVNPVLPVGDQIKKTEFNMDKKEVKIFYHYEKGKITAKEESYNRDDLQGQNKVGDMNDKEAEESKTQQIYKKILEMEHLCLDEIKYQEKTNNTNTDIRVKAEEAIRELKGKQDDEKEFEAEKYKKVLVKTIEKKARDKMKMDKKKDQEENEKEQVKDDLLPILKKLGLENAELDEEAAVSVKNEALRNLKERLLIRAEIIQKRLEEEQKKLEDAFAKLKKKGDQQSPEDQKNYET
jgi:hypothetical protein